MQANLFLTYLLDLSMWECDSISRINGTTKMTLQKANLLVRPCRHTLMPQWLWQIWGIVKTCLIVLDAVCQFRGQKSSHVT